METLEAPQVHVMRGDREPLECSRGGALECPTPGPPLFRPAQFLGSKTRVIPALQDAVACEIAPRARIVDLFSGSSVVSQGLAQLGYAVTAYDALEHCTHFARALLGVGRCTSTVDLRSFDPWSENGNGHDQAWSQWLEREDEAVRSKDSEALIAVSKRVPQIWRPLGASEDLAREFSALRPGTPTPAGLVVSHYAGTYFGVRQAIEIDTARAAIAHATATHGFSAWDESVLLTALLSAASECAFSAGKHYAQPHRIREGKDLGFVRQRIVTDRSKSIRALFRQRVLDVLQAAATEPVHDARNLALEELLQRTPEGRDVAAVYADPPYTAQQYSRFYHVPEVISENRVPDLQKVKGEVTRGLYPTHRHKSRFCSRRAAPEAFRDLISFTRARNATLFLSYSYSRSGETGNQRSIELTELRALLRPHFAEIEEREVGVRYRQFNESRRAVSGRSDAELLIIGRPRP